MGQIGTQLRYIAFCSMLLTAFMSSASSAQSDKSLSYFCTAKSSAGTWYNSFGERWETDESKTDKNEFVLGLNFLRLRTEKDFANRDEVVTDYEVTVTHSHNRTDWKCENKDRHEATVGEENGILKCSVGGFSIGGWIEDLTVNLKEQPLFVIGWAGWWVFSWGCVQQQ